MEGWLGGRHGEREWQVRQWHQIEGAGHDDRVETLKRTAGNYELRRPLTGRGHGKIDVYAECQDDH